MGKIRWCCMICNRGLVHLEKGFAMTTATFRPQPATSTRIDLGTIPRGVLSILSKRASPLSADELHRALTRGRHESTLPAVYKAIAKLRGYGLIEPEAITSDRQAEKALEAAGAIAARLQGMQVSKTAPFVARFHITPKGIHVEAGLALDVRKNTPERKRQALVQRFLKIFLQS